MEQHKMVKSRSYGSDGWLLVCACGRRWTGWRWLCEERYTEHLPEPEQPERAQYNPEWEPMNYPQS